jgi:hypothetical protein
MGDVSARGAIVWVAIGLAAAIAGGIGASCSSSDTCRQLPPAFELDVRASDADAPRIGSIAVSLEVGADRWRQAFDTSGGLKGGQTSLVVRIEPKPDASFMAKITVEGRSGAGGSGDVIASGSMTFSATPDACNRFEIALASGGPGLDGGVPDVGPTDGPAIDGALFDGGLSDSGADGGSNDAGEIEAGPSDLGPDDAAADDAAPGDAAPAADATAFPYTPSNFMTSQVPAVGGVVSLGCGVSAFDSMTLAFTNWCGSTPPVTTMTQPSGPDAVILSMSSFSITPQGSLRITGNRPVILAVFGAASISGPIDLGASSRVFPPIPGPGGSLAQSCMNATGTMGGGLTGGGGGGAFGGAAAAGGAGADGDPGGAPGAPTGVESLIPLRGGCAGGDGAGGATATRDHRGEGGGAIQISAAGPFLLASVINAGGGGGLGGARRNGGGGAGSGGAVLIEGVMITIGSGSAVAANGGGGGEGGADDSGHIAVNGQDGSTIVASGGANGTTTGGAGGAGATAGSGPGIGRDGIQNSAGGGGGGGGLGRIRLNAQTGCTIQGMLSPRATSNGAPGCP